MLIELLIGIIVLCVVIYALSILLNMIDIPPAMKQLVWLIIFVVVLIIILSWVSGGGLDTVSLGRDRRV